MTGRGIDYERHGSGYSDRRRPDPRIAARITAALGGAATVLNVGAGTGSYEPTDRRVVAVEPSATMRAQRPVHLASAVAALAEDLPLVDRSVDAAMAVLTVHHWSDPARGLRELRRVSRGPIALVTFDVEVKRRFWLISDYLPEVAADDLTRFPGMRTLNDALGGRVSIEALPLPAEACDGFFEAHWAHPEAYLDPAVRAAQSAWPRLPPGVERRALDALEADLASGRWDARHGDLRTRETHDGGLVLVVAHP